MNVCLKFGDNDLANAELCAWHIYAKVERLGLL